MGHKNIRGAVCSSATALALLLSATAAMPVWAADDADCIFRDSFDTDDCGWGGRGSGTAVAVSSDQPYQGSGALLVSGRGAEWHGPQKDISSVCSAGTAYSFSVCARCDSTQNVTFLLSLAYKDASGTTVYDHLAEAQTMSGNYVQLANAEYTIPSGATDTVLYVETKSGSASFLIDEAICAKSGTVIDGPKPVKFTLGDVNTDGTINAVDFALAKRYMGNNFPNKTMQRAADVDQSGTVDLDDITWYQRFLTAQETAYPEPVKPPVEPYDYDPAMKFHAFNESVYLSNSAQAGKVVEEYYDGPKGRNRLYVYLPYGYDESRQYNILYLLHGGGEDETTLFFHKDTQMQHIFDHMIENGDMDPMIIVTPTWNQTGAEYFSSELRERVIPFVEGKYSTYAKSTDPADLQASRFHRAYGGFSMGSISTWGVLTNCLDIIAYYMPLSGEFRFNNYNASQMARAVADAIDKAGLQKNEYFIFGATGSNDMAQPNMTPMMNEMRKLSQFVETSDFSQGNFWYMIADGKEHWWQHVRHYVYDILPTFFHEGQ